MSRRSPYEGHADFYLLDLWQQRAELDAMELAALREEMARRGLSIDDADEAGPYRELPPPERDGPPCPTCGEPTAEGRVVLAAPLRFRRAGERDEKEVFPVAEAPPA